MVPPEFSIGNSLPAIFLLGFLLVIIVCSRSVSSSKAEVPVAGSSLLFGYVTAWKATNGEFLVYIVEGYRKHKSKPFQIPGLRAWAVYLSGKFVQEVRKVPDDVLSFRDEINEFLALEYTMGKAIAEDYFHVDIARRKFKDLTTIFPAIYDEISAAFDDELGAMSEGEWTAIPAYKMVISIVCRASNRLFIGLPLCRDKEFTAISRDFSSALVGSAMLITIFPEFLRPFAAKFLSQAPSTIAKFEKFVMPIVEERKHRMESEGENWKDKPNDFMQWMLDAAQGTNRSLHDLTLRMLPLNFAGTHTTSMTFTHALFYLAAYPQYVDPLRMEIEPVVAKNGWTIDALNAMRKVDSFIKESMRIKGIDATSMKRKVLKSFTFSDGTAVPKGGHLAINMWSVHHDAAIYPNPDVFLPFRFCERHDEMSESDVKVALTTASPDFLAWGYGAHSCAGRYFAAQEMKAMFAHIIVHYDIALEREGVMPVDKWVYVNCVPDSNAKVLFRKRRL